MARRAARVAGRAPPNRPIATAKRVDQAATAGAKWKRNLISVKEEKFTVEKDSSPRS